MPFPWILSAVALILTTYKCTKVTQEIIYSRHVNSAPKKTNSNATKRVNATSVDKIDSAHSISSKLKASAGFSGSLAGFYTLRNKLHLGVNQFWGSGDTGVFGNYFESNLISVSADKNYRCVYSSSSLTSRGSCFTKIKEGFFVPEIVYHSHAFNCNVTECKVEAKLSLPLSSWEIGLNSSLTKLQLLKLLKPVRKPTNLKKKFRDHRVTIKIKFQGPGTRHVWFQPLYWNIGGYFRNHDPLNILNESNQFYANITYFTRNQYIGLDGFYGLNNPSKNPSTVTIMT